MRSRPSSASFGERRFGVNAKARIVYNSGRYSDSGRSSKRFVMAKRGKEKITVPSKREARDGSKLLRGGHPAGGRVLAELSVAARAKKRYRPKP